MRSLFDYEIIEQLHSGPRSLVCRASTPDGTALIVKIPNQPFPSFQQLASFKRGYACARLCRHPGVVHPLALELHGGRWTMLQEDSGALSLDRVLRARLADRQAWSQPALALDDLFDIALQLCAALEAVHLQGLIHKDINPSNLLWHGERRQLQLIDFGIASELASPDPGGAGAQQLEGTLRYMAPEQTGRMNRRVDHRADFYALGATLYELLTGQAPFEARDEMELVHCHIARSPDWSHPALARLPGQLLPIIQRLLEKNPEQRYQSLQGLRNDLAACRAPLAAQPHQLSFHDSRFLVPATLLGRDAAVASLLAALGRSDAGACELLLVAGSSGIGKSALVNEVRTPVMARRGFFVSGKLDLLQREVPYAALVRAFQALVHHLLGQPDDTLRQWAGKLRDALGGGMGAMVELIPELSLIVGATEALPAATPSQAQLRLDRLFPGFVDVFASAGRPLVLFLDDLQWADAATLRMIELLLVACDKSRLLIIGAYRDNEVGAAHPLIALRDKLLGRGARVSTLALCALSEPQVAQLVAATVRVAAPGCAALARMCYQKTAGNPFFLRQFLATLNDDGHLRYRADGDCWDWDLPAIKQARYTDNVVDALLDKIRRLPGQTQQLLPLAASSGNRFTLGTLALAVDRAPGQVRQDLAPALVAGLVLPSAGAGEGVDRYRFLHDRVQQAAYLAVDAGARAANHLLLGRLLLAHTSDEQRDGKLFDIVEQLNAGRALIGDARERVQLAALNLQAGEKARRCAAFQATLEHMRTGLELLPAQAGHGESGLWLELQLGAAEASYLCGQFDAAEAIYALVRERALAPLQQVRCFAIQAHQYQLQGRLLEAIAVQREALALLGMAIPHEVAHMKARFDEIHCDIGQLPGARAPEALLAAGDMPDPVDVAAMQMMHGLWMASYYAGQQDLSALMVVSMTRLSMRRGSSDFSAVAYVGYAMMIALYQGDAVRGHDFGAMALLLARRRANLQARTQTGLIFAAMASHWTQPLRHSDALYEEALGWALEIGDFVQVGVVAAVRATERLILGDYLPHLLLDIEQHLALMRANGQQAMADCCVAGALAPIRCLMGLTARSDSYDDALFSEAGFLEQYGHSRLYRAYFLQGKIRNAYLFDSADAEPLAAQLTRVTGIMRGQAKVVESSFYAALIWLRALRRDRARPDAADLLARVEALQDSLAAWASQGSDTSAARHLLVQAEMARYRNELQIATRSYQQAIAAAGLAGQVNMQALGNELCGECWIEHEHPRVAAVFMIDAIAHYEQWGAHGKVAQLRAIHAVPMSRIRAHAGASVHAGAALDMVSLLKAATTLSNEVGLGNVLTRLIAIVCENAGAQVARLLLLSDGAYRVEAEIDGDAITVLQSRQLDLDAASDPQFPLSLLRYVMRTGVEVIEDGVTGASRFAADPYVRQRARAIMCLPIRHGGQIDGILYFENRLADASFTHERVTFLRMLGAQAMISIASARLHDSLERRVAERTEQLEAANRQLATLSITDGLTGLANRRHFDDVLRSEHARSTRAGQPLSVIMLDVDYFKRYNDRYGHQAGDTCLVKVAQALLKCMRRASDLTARYGGEEFSIVLPDTGVAEARQIGDALRATIEALGMVHAGADAGQVTISVGIAVQPALGAFDADALLRLADAALYRAKDAGRNCVVVETLAPG
ncbi:diguanylate cyclase domain-containing protein [Janthinobacterium psychrotolerans]|uniref:Diguanylate cyclase (GGDEF) domain-containing protein n=1 Tax=Janthinobacterium psychrotolerans TaxID=1747903 RepID=A0A1A7BTH4_9BURK|nr:diguanylate cyclase [Janthinobacterium psychrotolerans]OBV36841.1 diguanylate cyclase (GGDEF) domain-containing protein [Janthinobacterium psychrotolerans]